MVLQNDEMRQNRCLDNLITLLRLWKPDFYQLLHLAYLLLEEGKKYTTYCRCYLSLFVHIGTHNLVNSFWIYCEKCFLRELNRAEIPIIETTSILLLNVLLLWPLLGNRILSFSSNFFSGLALYEYQTSSHNDWESLWTYLFWD